MKPEKIKLVIDGKTIERGKLSKKDPRMVFYIEHSKITERLKAGRPADQAAAGYAERAAAEILEAALSALEDLAAQDPKAAARLKKQFFLAASDSPVTYEDGEPVQLKDFEEV